MVIGITVAAALVSVGVALNMPNIYVATARILPPQQGQSSVTAMPGQLGSFAGAAGGTLGIKNPNDLFIGMMKSCTLTNNLVGCRHNAAGLCQQLQGAVQVRQSHIGGRADPDF